MKALSHLALTLLLAAPAALFAVATADGRIEDAAIQSYNFRAVLDGRVGVRSQAGHVTLTGSLHDHDARALAQDTVENLPGVTGVTNLITIVPPYVLRSDSWLAVRIRTHLLVKANVSATNTIVSVHDGVATLGGNATSLAQKDLTGVYAAEIDGVRAVRNNIVVRHEPTPRERIDDASITSQVRFALRRHPATHSLPTKVTTLDGVVHVTGEAGSAAEKSLVTKLAQDVRGTAAVTNDMVIKG